MTSTQCNGAQPAVPRREIELSWRRSRLFGVAPEFDGFSDLPVAEVDPRSRLLDAASVVLDQMAAALTGTAYSLLLGDRDCRLVYRWFDDPRFESALDMLGIRDGASLAEDAVGTNALGTALETKQGITVNGSEHFIERFKGFTCYGHPIRHPVTRRLAGVLDITSTNSHADPILGPFLQRAVHDIEQRLLDQSKASERALLAAFQTLSRQRRAVAAVGDDIVLTNRSAVDLLDPSDYALLHLLAEQSSSRPGSTDVRLASGTSVRIHLSRVAGASTGMLFHFEPIEDSTFTTSVRGSTRPLERGPAVTGPVLIVGDRGTGRSTEARRLARAREVEFHQCADIADAGTQEWLALLRDRVARPGVTVCVDALPEPMVDQLIGAMEDAPAGALILTSLPLRATTGAHAALAAMCVDRIELAPLRDRAAELPAITKDILRELDPSAELRLLPSVIELLATHPWPGNLHELKAVLAHVLQHRHRGDVTIGDLPARYRVSSRARTLSGRERAERDAIIDALRRHHGNKLRTAHELGISRTTLYARLKALRITDGHASAVR
ncbi:sigma-54-dependent Fis family transcriptional regulator [Nocardia spumae]|uniref:sigma-54-dependent Fis family transcriptional regulator n=1 Tax=Nocardia spumae TaxID=2887190 RepID=UPI001D13C3D4|nr:helix-turn-helix domain-containing protein [Nocardia spumae]